MSWLGGKPEPPPDNDPAPPDTPHREPPPRWPWRISPEQLQSPRVPGHTHVAFGGHHFHSDPSLGHNLPMPTHNDDMFVTPSLSMDEDDVISSQPHQPQQPMSTASYKSVSADSFLMPSSMVATPPTHHPRLPLVAELPTPLPSHRGDTPSHMYSAAAASAAATFPASFMSNTTADSSIPSDVLSPHLPSPHLSSPHMSSPHMSSPVSPYHTSDPLDGMPMGIAGRSESISSTHSDDDQLRQATDTIGHLERKLKTLQSKVDQLERGHPSSPQIPGVSSATPPPMQRVTDPPPMVHLAVRAEGIKTEWYADRPYPAFSVEVVDVATGHACAHANNWELGLTMVDGHGNDATDKLAMIGRATHETDKNLSVVIVRGRATVNNIRFTKVSSKYGGTYRLVVALTRPANWRGMVQSYTSAPIQIKSYRLYHCQKLPMEAIKPKDPVSRMKGIGTEYSKRLKEIGIVSVVQLANLDVDSMTDERRRQFLGKIRQERGSMTQSKLAEYIGAAREIVTKYDQQQNEYLDVMDTTS